MSASPNYKYYRHPRFSVNQIAQYLSASNANQRANIIQESKFQKKVPVIAYDQSKRAMRDFLTESGAALSYFDTYIRRFESRIRREPEGWMRDEMERNIEAITAFKNTFTRRRARRYNFSSGPRDRIIRLDGVVISVRLDALVPFVDEDNITYEGGCVLFVARTVQSRRNIEHRLRAVSAMIQWSLETADSNIEVLPRLCMAIDVFGATITKAPSAVDRLRSQIRSACNEAAARWDSIAPPPDYDGPAWR